MALHRITTNKSTIFFLSSKHFNWHVSSVALYKHIIPTHFKKRTQTLIGTLWDKWPKLC